MKINTKQLNKFMNNDPSRVQRFLDSYWQEVESQFPQMLRQFQAQDWASLSITAHTLKSQSAYLGIKPLHELLYQIEKAADRKKGLDKLPSHFAKLQKLWQQIKAVN